MTSHTLPPRAMSALIGQFSAPLMVTRHSPTARRAADTPVQQDYTADRWQDILGIVMADPDDRLDLLQTICPAFTEDHIAQIASITKMWLNQEAREQLRSLAKRCVRVGGDPSNILAEWGEEAGYQSLADLFTQTTIPDHTLALGFAISEAYGVAYAAYFISLERANHRENFDRIVQTEEEITEDIRFADAR